ncbi:hypothetical protein PaeCFBP13512_22190 [Paenibacillus sp. CFBP13512]|uniref:hypothetical protein n=1 Tax=Paenibacillus sp. CFBP13512 TaxID=2184007 RepID=UPI0010BFCD3D|nr:hypothetical protein [Paenibacillus sp. CFBP13512]TKJ83833.1 hypothetical protein PaeCFBP13512_22190 [Paenibacillus sp. CFBP13512]
MNRKKRVDLQQEGIEIQEPNKTIDTQKAPKRTSLQQIMDKLSKNKMDLSDLPNTIPVLMTYDEAGHQLVACTYSLDFLKNAPFSGLQNFTTSEKIKMENLMLIGLKEGYLNLQHFHLLLLQMYGSRIHKGYANLFTREHLQTRAYQVAQTLPEVYVLNADNFLMQTWLQMAGTDRVLPATESLQLSMRSDYIKGYGLPIRNDNDFSPEPPEWISPKPGYLVNSAAGSKWYNPATLRNGMR